MPDAKRLARLHRVRTLQLGLVRADEANAHARFASEAALTHRIAALADGVAPAEATEAGFSFAAAAHYRERLHVSAQAAEARLAQAAQRVASAGERTREARRDQSAIEKLIARADADAALAAVRALEAAPPTRKLRHDPC